MGYACPVCEDPQADAGHLANHLAFTAILHGGAHEAWLDERVPGWGELGESELADQLVEEVEDTEFPQVFDDTVGGLEESTDEPFAERSGALFEADSEHVHGRTSADAARAKRDPDPPTDTETAAILEEAREMTRELLGEGDVDDSTDGADRTDTGDESE